MPDGCQFYVFPEAEAYFKDKKPGWKTQYEQWKKTLESWKKENPDLAKDWEKYFGGRLRPFRSRHAGSSSRGTASRPAQRAARC